MDRGGVEPFLTIVTVRRGTDGSPLALYGFGLPVQAMVEAVIQPILALRPLLPVPVSTGVVNDSVLAIALESPDGAISLPLTASRAVGDFAAAIPAGMYFGGWRLRLTLNPTTAPPFLIGELPRSRTPLLTGLAVVTGLLVGTICLLAARASALARARADFVASVSHELRTPLAQILLFSETLSLGRMTTRGEVRDAAAIIAGETRRLMHLVETVLTFGRRFRADQPPPPRRREALAPLIQEAVAGFAPIAAQRGATVTARIEAALSAPVDRDALRQVLLNLLDNAVKYGPHGQHVTVVLDGVDGSARLSVRDQGPGIPLAERRRVWQPFVRLEREVEAATAGSGLGLAVVWELIEAHRGRVLVEETPSGGACVAVELPGAEPSVAVEVACTS